MKIRDTVLAIVNAALYALIGIATTLGVFAIVVGGVRFWPSVFIPAVFAQVFGPIVGGLGAAIGIFISDMIVHGNALVSLTIGVPANFIGFYILGAIARSLRNKNSGFLVITAIILQFIPAVALYYLYLVNFIDLNTALIFICVALAAAIGIAISLAMLIFKKKSYIYPGEALAYSIGLLLGSLYIGLGLWLYSHIARLDIATIPPEFRDKAPFAAALVWFLWTYYTEIPFMIYLTPPIVRSIEAWLKRYRYG